MKIFIVPMVVITTLLSIASPAQSPSRQLLIREILDSFRTGLHVPGLSATVIDPRGVTDAAVGESDTATHALLTSDNKLMSGSTGKILFATSVLQLAQQGKLKLDDPAMKYLGRFSWFSRIPNSNLVTIRQLLHHTGGIQEYYETGDFTGRLLKDPDRTWRPEELLAYVFGLKPLFAPDSSFSYADTDFILLAMIIEEITGAKAYDYIQQHIIGPASLNNTVPSIARTLPGLANGYSTARLPFRIEGAMLRDGKMIINPQFEWGGGGFATSPHDLARLLTKLMHGEFLDSFYLAEMKKEVPARQLGRQNFYGLGLEVVKSAIGTSYGHSGWFPGYQTDVEYFPELDLCIAVQMNTDHSDVGFVHPRSVIYRVARKLQNQATRKN